MNIDWEHFVAQRMWINHLFRYYIAAWHVCCSYKITVPHTGWTSTLSLYNNDLTFYLGIHRKNSLLERWECRTCRVVPATVWVFGVRWGGVHLDLRHFNHMPFFLLIVPLFSPTSSQLKHSIFVQSITILLAFAPPSPLALFCSPFGLLLERLILRRPQQHSPWQTTSRSIKHREDLSCWLPVRRARRERHAVRQASTSRLWLVVNKKRRGGLINCSAFTLPASKCVTFKLLPTSLWPSWPTALPFIP